MGADVLVTKCWVICSICGQSHRLLPGVIAPIYWCGNILKGLVEGDDVEYEENDNQLHPSTLEFA